MMTLESLIAASPEDFNGTLDDENPIETSDMLSRRRTVWDDDMEDEEEF